MAKLASFIAAAALAFSGTVAVSGPAWALDYDCSDFSTQQEAQQYLLPGDPYRLDADGDGTACDSLPSGGGGTSSGSTGGGSAAHKTKATVTIKIARKPVAAHRWKFTCAVKRSGKAYVGKKVAEGAPDEPQGPGLARHAVVPPGRPRPMPFGRHLEHEGRSVADHRGLAALNNPAPLAFGHVA